jgi:hypothetical protein
MRKSAWTTLQEYQFLEGHIPRFLKHQETGGVGYFLAQVTAAFFLKFPSRSIQTLPPSSGLEVQPQPTPRPPQTPPSPPEPEVQPQPAPRPAQTLPPSSELEVGLQPTARCEQFNSDDMTKVSRVPCCPLPSLIPLSLSLEAP